MGPLSSIRLGTANIARLILSLIIAFAIWAFVTNERDPERSQTFNDLELTSGETLRRDLQVVDSFPTVDVTVKGPQSVVQGMTAQDVVPTVDLSGIDEAGQHEVEVEVDAPSGLRDIEVEPESITIEVGTVVSREMEVSIVEPVNPPATLTSISVSPSQVTLVGVEHNVERVVAVEVRVALSGRSESFTITAQPIPIGDDGQEMTDIIRVEPASVQVSVEFEVRARSVPVIVQCACPSESGGLEIRDLLTAIAIPSTVRVEGPEPLLEDISAIRTLPISIDALEVSGFLPNGAELDTSTLPEGVSLERQTIDVYVEIEQSIQSFSQIEIQPVNAPDNARIMIDPETISFELQGPAEVLATLGENPPVVLVDLDDLDAGAHSVVPRLVLPPEVRVVNLEPEEVQVTIEMVPPTPTSTPAPEATSIPSTSSRPLQMPVQDGVR